VHLAAERGAHRRRQHPPPTMDSAKLERVKTERCLQEAAAAAALGAPSETTPSAPSPCATTAVGGGPTAWLRAKGMLSTSMVAVASLRARVVDTVKCARGVAVTWTEAAWKKARVDEAVGAARAACGTALRHATAARQQVEHYAESVCAAAAAMWNTVKAKGVKGAVVDSLQRALQLAQHAGSCAQARVAEARALAAGRAREARDTAAGVLNQATSKAVEKKNLAKETATGALDQITERASKAASLTQAKATEVTSNVKEIVADKKFQATAAPAVGGAMVGCVSGGAAGLAVGGMIGAAVGVVPAPFTFGLSIPVGAMMGAGTGFVVGTGAGAAAGAAGGGAAGYAVYSKGGKLRCGAGHARDYVKGKAEWAATQASVAASSMKEKATVVGTVVSKRLVSTGGTEDASD